MIKTKQPRVRPECIVGKDSDCSTITVNVAKNSNNQPWLEVANTVNCDGYLERGVRNRDGNGKAVLTSQCNRRIRRLTPLECERLQGYDGNYTKFGIDENGKKIEISDTQRYKMMGNAVSEIIPQIIGERLLDSWTNNGQTKSVQKKAPDVRKHGGSLEAASRFEPKDSAEITGKF